MRPLHPSSMALLATVCALADTGACSSAPGGGQGYPAPEATRQEKLQAYRDRGPEMISKAEAKRERRRQRNLQQFRNTARR